MCEWSRSPGMTTLAAMEAKRGRDRAHGDEFYERQHSEAVPFFDKPDRLTVSGVSRGEQRALYDEQRRRLIPQRGIRLVILTLDDFQVRRGKILRDHDRDLEAVAKLLA